MHEDGRQSEKGIGPGEWRCRECHYAEWFNAGPILFSWGVCLISKSVGPQNY
jgi:hypothetical protein